ncbi:acyltransferase family protein [Draconibacterium orientale]|uniref:acyltransferase family protein n=1 Tax=Draconibacterium orientale TaxID=1168034 RepID=UPI002A0A6782|nr:acyltransferase family protein [Draconibacterium orientale]
MTTETISNLKNTRRTDLDWLRVLAVLLLVPFHSALIFIADPHVVMYVKDGISSSFLNRFAGWIHQFHMPLLFYVSGAATYFSLKKRKSGQYIKERLLKLLIPAISGLMLVIPPITYIAQIAKGNSLTYWQHFTNFWQLGNADLTGMDGKFTPAHLWFLLFLFVFSLVGLLFFSLLKKDKSIEFFQRIIDKTGSSVIILVLFVLLTSVADMNILGDKNPVYYFLIFFCGYLFMMDDRFQHTIDKYAWLFLATGISCEIIRQFSYSFISSGTVVLILSNLNRWMWLLCILGFGHRSLKANNRVLKSLSSASFPFYIFHLLLNTIAGFYIIKLPIGAGTKYSLIVVFTILSTFLVYGFVKRIPVIRFLFGIKRR